jgi:pyridinium-3,5-biscarboxylic acid mononucleotide sulfurtransferase
VSLTESLDVASRSGVDRLRARLDVHERLVVAFSGGADSALLAYVATNHLGPDAVLCATASSASLAPDEAEETRTLAADWGLRHILVDTNELADPNYIANGTDRCYYCKAELMDVLGPIAQREHAVVALGVNVDDLGDHRPGQGAALERGAVFPLLEANLTKAEIRSISQALGLRTHDKPAAACLASRIPHGTPVTVELLTRVGRAEAGLRRLGFGQLRVRDYGETARIELESAALAEAVERREAILSLLRSCGYRYVTVDLAGFSSGNLVRSALEHEHTNGAQ